MPGDCEPLLAPDPGSTAVKGQCKLLLNRSQALPDDCPASLRRTTCYLQEGGHSSSGKREPHTPSQCQLLCTTQHQPVQVTKKLLLACSLSFAFMIVEVVGGYFAGSVAIMADAAHMFSDVLSFLISAYCTHLIARRTNLKYTFGYHRAETIGAVISVLIVCVLTGSLCLEAVQRLLDPVPIDGRLMFIVAVVGIGFNLLLLATLGHEHHHHLGGGSCSHGCGHGHDHGHAPAGGCGGGHSHAHDSHAHDDAHAPGGGCGGDGHDHAPSGGCGHGHAHGHDHGHKHDSSCGGHAHGAESTTRTATCGGAEHAVSLAAPRSAAGSLDVAGPVASACGHGHGHSHGHGHGHSHGHDNDHGSDAKNHSMRGALLHVMGDLVQSVGVAIGGAIIWATGGDPNWLWIDPCCTFLFAIGVVWVTRQLIVDLMHDLMEGSPEGVEVDVLIADMEAVPGVICVHDLHVWSIGSGKNILMAHIDAEDDTDPYQLIDVLEGIIYQRAIGHSTVQICSGRLAPSGKEA